MSRTERRGTRSWVWSVFHRSMPRPAYMIDLDYLECCPYCRQTLIIGELAKDIGQSFKATTILRDLAKRARVIGLLIFYNEEVIVEVIEQALGHKPDSIPVLTELELAAIWRGLYGLQAPVLRVMKIYPERGDGKSLTATEFYDYLSRIHSEHEKVCTAKQPARTIDESL